MPLSPLSGPLDDLNDVTSDDDAEPVPFVPFLFGVPVVDPNFRVSDLTDKERAQLARALGPNVGILDDEGGDGDQE